MDSQIEITFPPSSQIKTLLKNQDNAEKIRDQIAAILKLELTNQKLLADNDKEIVNKKDFDIKVYIENARPWLLLGDTAVKNPFPLVNVSLQDTKKDTGSGITGKVKYTGTFFIDCYGCGNYQPENEKEFIPDDYLSTVRAWQTARITRNIIMSGFYAYLGMKPIVRKREIQSTVTVIPGGLQDSAISITACRITLIVDFEETSLEATGIEFNGISFTSNDSGEVNLIDIMSDNDKKNQSKE